MKSVTRRTLLQGLVAASGLVAAPVLTSSRAVAATAGAVTAAEQMTSRLLKTYPVDGLGRSVTLRAAAESQRLVEALAAFLRMSSLDLGEVLPVGYAPSDQPLRVERPHFTAAVCVAGGAFDRGRCEGLTPGDQVLARAIATHYDVTWGGNLAADATGLFLAEPQTTTRLLQSKPEGPAQLTLDTD